MTTGVARLWAQRPGADAVDSDGVTETFDVSMVQRLRLDVEVLAFDGGTDPTIMFSVDVLGADGQWYTAVNGAAIAAPSVAGFSVGPGTGNPVLLTGACRVRWTLDGTAPPDSVTFTASLIGRN